MSIIFLDRDGVINTFPGFGSYVTRWEDFHFLPNAVRAIAALTRAGFEILVVSNQGGVARGLLTSSGLKGITDRMLGEIEKGGGRIGGVFYCEHGKDQDCGCKKPKLGLFHQALRGRRVEPGSVFLIGDAQEDLEAGRKLGCSTLLVLSGRIKETELPQLKPKPDFVKKDLWEAACWILEKKS